MKTLRIACLVAVLALSACGDRTIHSGDLTLSRNPAEFPEDFPPELVYPSGKPKLLGVLDTAGFWSPAQYAVLIETTDQAETVIDHYLNLLKRDNWQILQSRHFEKDGKTVIVAESFVQQTVTIVVEDGEAARVKLYLKKSSDD